jgi:hypothetical protein
MGAQGSHPQSKDFGCFSCIISGSTTNSLCVLFKLEFLLIQVQPKFVKIAQFQQVISCFIALFTYHFRRTNYACLVQRELKTGQ